MILDVIFAGILQKVLIYVKLGFLGWIFCGFLQPSFVFFFGVDLGFLVRNLCGY